MSFSERPASFHRSSHPRVSSPSSTSSSKLPPIRPASAMPLTSFIASRTSHQVQRTSRAFGGSGHHGSHSPVSELSRNDSPPPNSGLENPFDSNATFSFSGPDLGASSKQRRLEGFKLHHGSHSPVSELSRGSSPPPSSELDNPFDSNATFSFSDPDLDASSKQRRLEGFKLPIPTFVSGTAAPRWEDAERAGSTESGFIEQDTKPAIFDDRIETIKTSQPGMLKEYYDGNQYEAVTGDNREEFEVGNGPEYRYEGDEGYDGDEVGRFDEGFMQQRGGGVLDGFEEETAYMDDKQEEEQEEQEGLWDETRTISSTGWTDNGGNDALAGRQVAGNGNRGKEFRVRGGPIHRHRRRDFPPRPIAVSKQFGPSKPRNPVPQTDPDQTVRPGDLRPVDSAVARQRVELGTPLLSDSELVEIPSYDELLLRLQRIHTDSRSAPPRNLETELEALVEYAYPSRDLAKPKDFFGRLADDAYENAGAVMARKKRELEAKINEASVRRRGLARGRAQEVQRVAERCVGRLGTLQARREQLRGGVGRLLAENGFSGGGAVI